MPKITIDQADKLRDVARAGVSLLLKNKVSDPERKAFGESGLKGDSLMALLKSYRHACGDRDAFAKSNSATLREFRNSVATADLENILGPAVERKLTDAYNDAATSWMPITTIQPVRDFRAFHVTQVSSFSDMLEVKSGMPFEYGGLSDRGESATAAVYGRGMLIPEKVLVNDQVGVVSQITQQAARAFAYKIETLIYDKIYANGPVSEDGENLFSAAHGNLQASGGAPSVSEISAMRKLLRHQTAQKGMAGDSDRRLNLEAKYVVVPSSLETTAETILASNFDPAGTNSRTYNPFGGGTLELVVSSYLDSLSATEWYLSAGNELFPNIVLLSLTGDAQPKIRTEMSRPTEPLGLKMDIHGAVAPLIAGFRGLAKNAGE